MFVIINDVDSFFVDLVDSVIDLMVGEEKVVVVIKIYMM